MHETPSEKADAGLAVRRARPASARRALRLGIGARLAFGLAAVAIVIVVGHRLATQTTRRAVESVRSMQTDHEPIVRRATTAVEKLVAYDRAVSEYLQAARAPDMDSITAERSMLATALSTYFENAPADLPDTSSLRDRIEAHVRAGEVLAEQATQRTD